MRLRLQVADERAEADLELEGEACLLTRGRCLAAAGPGATPSARAEPCVYVYQQQGRVLIKRVGKAVVARINDCPVGDVPCQLFDHDLLQVGEGIWRVVCAGASELTGTTEFYAYPEEQCSDTEAVESDSASLAATRLHAAGPGDDSAATGVPPADGASTVEAVCAATGGGSQTRLAPLEFTGGGDTTRLSPGPDGSCAATVLDNGHTALADAARVGRPAAGREPGRPQHRKWWLVAAGLLPAAIYLSWLLMQAPVSPGPPSLSSARDLVSEHLAAGQLTTLPAQLLRLHRTQPADVPTRQLLEDANRLQDLLHLRDTGQWSAFATLRNRSFHTDLFEQTARYRVDREVMGVASLRRYNRAAGAWREGRLVDALNDMRALAQDTSDAAAVETLAHYRRVIEGSDKLAALTADARYGALLVEHYLDLAPVEDAFYWSRLGADIAAANPPLPAALGEELAGMGGYWRSYHQQGGITGTLRQQPGYSEIFRQRAMELGHSCRALSRLNAALAPATETAAVETVALPSRNLPRRLQTELSYQRARLETLLAVNEDPDLRQRLHSLPAASSCPDA